jgi:hypothetical protein
LQDFTTNSIEYVNSKIAAVNPLAEKNAKEKTKQAFSPKTAEGKRRRTSRERKSKKIKKTSRKFRTRPTAAAAEAAAAMFAKD